MSYEFYRVLHVFAIILLFTSLGALAAAAGAAPGGLRRVASIAHGVALVIILVAGFGLLARLGMFGAIPNWAWAKFGLWLLLGAAVVPLNRKPEMAPWVWAALPFIGGLAAWLAITKPF